MLAGKEIDALLFAATCSTGFNVHRSGAAASTGFVEKAGVAHQMIARFTGMRGFPHGEA